MGDVHGRASITAGDVEADFTVVDDGVDVEDVAGDVAFEQVVGLFVAELFEGGPEFSGIVDLFDAHGPGGTAGFEDPGGGDAVDELLEAAVVEDVDEVRNGNAGAGGDGAHGEFVAEVAGGGFAEAGQAEVFAEGGGFFEVEVIEGDDAVDGFGAGEIADGFEGVVEVPDLGLVGHVEEVVQGFARPLGGFLEAEGRKQKDAGAPGFGLAEKGVAFFIARDGEKSERVLAAQSLVILP